MCTIFDYRYMGRRHLKGFENYRYNSKDTSPLSNYVMHPFWNLTVKIFPMWIAPNVLTVVGFMFTVANGLLLTVYDPYFYASSDDYPQFPPIPSFVWVTCALFHFLAHTLDGIDGKQARRTNSSGPLGELMDHGLDSWTSFFIPFCIYSIFGRADYSQSPLQMLFICWSIFITFYLSHWEKYNTGTLYLPWSYDASQIGLFALYLITFSRGYEFWKFTIPIFHITSGNLFEIIAMVASLAVSVPLTVYNVYTCSVRKQSNFWESIRPLVSLAILFAVTTLWAIFSHNKIIDVEPRTFYFIVGTVFSNIACRLIVSQMSSTRCELFNLLLVPLTMSTIASTVFTLTLQHELWVLRANAIIATCLHLHYGICIVRQMCEHFNIYCFVLGKRSPDTPEQEALVNSP